MVSFFDRDLVGNLAGDATVLLGYRHIIAGGLIFLAVFLRFRVRQMHGCPVHPADRKSWVARLSRVTHFTLYGLLFVMPHRGAAAWFAGSETFASLRQAGWTVLMIVVALHNAGILIEHFWFRTNVLRGMMTGQGRFTKC